MTNPNVPEVTDEDRRLARKWAESMSPDINGSSTAISIARVILDAVPAPPNLSDMAWEEREATRWMRCDVAGIDGDWLIIDPFDDESHVHVVGRRGNSRVLPTHHITPRPDLARMEWEGSHAPTLPGDWKLADHPEHGRIVVTRSTPTRDGHVYFVAPTDDTMRHNWHFCKPDALTYLAPDPNPERNQND